MMKRRFKLFSRSPLALAAALWLACESSAPAEATSIPSDPLAFFESSIRPLLAEHCYRCHSVDAEKLRGGLLLDSRWGWQQGGESGQVIVPGAPEESRLIRSVAHDPDVEAMPPKSKLSPEKIQALTDWIAMGAPDPRPKREPDHQELDFDLEERKTWWSLQPIADVTVPPVEDEAWPTHEIDRFVLAQLESLGWQPAGPADRPTWIRRVTYDLTGLPPTKREIDAFLADASPEAHRKVVDRLLKSPRFGEHWGRKWLDLVRYAETKAFEADYSMPHAYRYRDYVIKVFNDDVPFDRFVLESLAGDLLGDPRIDEETGENESLKGPGFVYLGGGHHAPPDLHEDEARVFDGAIDVIGKAFLGTTIACARCHDHKFDAVTTADYYSLYGILASSPFAMQNAVHASRFEKAAAGLEGHRDVLRKALAARLVRDLATAPEDLEALARGDVWETPTGERWERILRGPLKAGSPEGALRPLREVVLGAEEKVASPEDEGEDVSPIGSLNEGGEFGDWRPNGEGFGEGSREPGSFVVGASPEEALITFVGGSAATGDLSSRIGGSLHSPFFVLDRDHVWVRVKGKGARVNLMIQHYELVGFGPTTNALSIPVDKPHWHWVSFKIQPRWKGLRAYLDVQMNGSANLPKSRAPHVYRHAEDAWVAVDRAALGNDRPRSLKREGRVPRDVNGWAHHLQAVAARWQNGTSRPGDDRWLEALFASGFALRGLEPSSPASHAWQEIAEGRRQIPVPRYVRTLTESAGADEPVYVRGSHKNLSDGPNPRRFLDALDPEPFGQVGSGRLAWARKVVEEGNPLTARVLVNRLWYHLFGRGIVYSVDDFGQMGSLPTHPALLEYLAKDFMASGWSVKSMLRKLALTSSYRMASEPSSESATMDPENKWLQHMPMRRLPAESIRDALLAVSGRLDLTMYGPGVPDALKEAEPSRSIPTQPGPVDGDGRRSVYLELRRNYLPAFLTTFDMPNASTPFGRRNVTTVPAQSLALMNDPFVIEQAEYWAGRILSGEATSFEARVHEMHERAFGRRASQGELKWAETTFADLAEEVGTEASVAPGCPQVWKEFCHVFFNRKEMIYVR